MDVAFSRDQPDEGLCAAQIWDRRRELIEWLDGGASFYVCGDAKAMAKDVRATLTRAYADVKTLAPEAAEPRRSPVWSAKSATCRTSIKHSGT